MRQPSFEVVPAEVYPQQLVTAITDAHERVALQSMVMAVDQMTEPIFDAAQQAADQRLAVTVLPDAYSSLFDDDMPAQPLTARGREARRRTGEFEHRIGRLASHGAAAYFAHPYRPWPPGPRSLNLFAGRNHAKNSVVDDHVFTGGGVNLGARYFGAVDYMLHMEHAGMAGFLYDYMDELAVFGRVRDTVPFRRYDYDDDSSLVIDTGLPGQSLIYEAATRLVRSAVQLTLVTQYPPKGKFRSLLAERQRRLPDGAVQIFHNEPRQFRQPARMLRTFEQNLPPILRVGSAPDGRLIHAKALLGRLEDGTPFTLSGSHNLQQSLVRMGTAETAVISTSSDLYEKVRRYLGAALIPA